VSVVPADFRCDEEGSDVEPEDWRARRVALGLSIYAFAQLAGLAERTVILIEAGLRKPRPTTQIALRRGLRRAEERAG
jgi:DNA-binding XRE family transcriptional regulator